MTTEMTPERPLPRHFTNEAFAWEEFTRFCVTRQDLYERRLVGYPREEWTVDPVLKTQKINNVYRELDRFSKWEIARFGCADNLSHLSQVKLVLLARFTLSVDATLELFDPVLQRSWSMGTLKALEGEGQLMNDVLPIDLRGYASQADLVDAYAEQVRHAAAGIAHCCRPSGNLMAVEDRVRRAKLTREVIDDRLYLADDFRRYEMMTSLTYLSGAPFTEEDFYHVGFGAAAALHVLFGKVPDSLESACLMADTAKFRLREAGFPFLHDHRGEKDKWTFRQLEDACCEWRKYLNCQAGLRDKPYVPREAT